MLQESERIPAETGTGFNINKTALVTILVCTGISMLFLRTGILAMLYLIPLGYAVIVTGSVWYTFFTASLANIVLTLIFSNSADNMWMNVFYITSLFLLFTWIMGGRILRTTYRFILASAAGAVAFLIIIFRSDSDFFTVFIQVANEFFQASASEELLETAKKILLCGGAFASVILMFYVNRQISAGIVSFVKRQKIDKGLASFYAPANTIWVLIGSLSTVVLASLFKIEIPEIIAWNILVICAIIYLVQGIGILMYLLTRRSPAFRVGVNILLIVVILSPVGLVVIISLLLIGIAENFRPIRNTIAPTPGPDRFN